MISLVAFLIIFGILIIVHEFGHFIVAKLQGVKVERFSIGFGPPLLKKKKKDTEYTVNAVPLGGYVKLAGDNLEEFHKESYEYLAKTPLQRATIIFSGPFLNYISAFLFFWLIFFIGFPTLSTKVGALIEGYGAKEAGIQVGDKIISVDGNKVDSFEDVQKIIYSKEGVSSVRVVVLRGNKEEAVDVRLKQKQLEDQMGQKHSIGLLGISPDFSQLITLRYGFWKSFILSAQKTWDITVITCKAIWRMITGKLSLRESVAGPLGIYYITAKAVSLGIISVLNLIGLLSVSLAIFNLLPLPLLDGGHLLLLIIERIRGKYLSLKAERIITQVGFTIIISLAVFVTYNDILRLFGDKISRFFK